jgi:hypothetical protein
MSHQRLLSAAALACLCIAIGGSAAHSQNAPARNAPSDPRQFDATRYPDWSGPMRWTQVRGGNRYDQYKPPGRGQEAPLTPEYQAKFEASLKDQAEGGQGANQTYSCLPGGLPRDMAGNQGLEFLVTPRSTHIIFVHQMPRRIYTDGRAWPEEVDPSYFGYSIGNWIDEDGDGKFDVLEAETRHFLGPRSFDNAGIPLHVDNQTVIKERLFRDKQNPEILHDVMTTIDHALTKPWTVDKTYKLTHDRDFVQNICSVGNNHVVIGKEAYYLSAEGFLMQAKRDQSPPDLRYFRQYPR